MAKRIASTFLSASLWSISTAISASAAQIATDMPAPVSPAVAASSVPALGAIVPAGAHVRFRLDAPLSSMDSTTGQRFGFTLIDPIVVGATDVAQAGAHGRGTVLLAGHAGSSGHEGDLTLRIDAIDTPSRYELGFSDARFEVNGSNHKIESGILGFVPFAGPGARFIRGREITIGTDVPILYVTARPATVMNTQDAEFLTMPVPVLPSNTGTIAPSPDPTKDASP